MARNSLFKLFSIAAVLMLVIAACGDDDDAEPTSTSPAEGGAPTETRETGDGTAGEDGGDDLAAMGEQLYSEQGCQACHSTDGSQGVGPTWQGLWQSEVPLADGSTVTADEAYITESIREPNAQVHEGFQEGVMPAFPDMPDEDINAIIAFIQTLSE